LGVLTAAICPEATAAPCDAVLEGNVIDVRSFSVVGGARVAAPEQVRAARTGDEGTYRLEGLCPGEIYVEVSKAGYQTHEERFTLRRGANRHDFFLLSGEIDSIRAEGTRLQATDRSPQASAELTGRDLAKTRGNDLARSLGDLPGVRVLGSGATAKPIVNGMNSNRLLLVVDGIPHANQDWGLDHAPEIDPFAAGSLRVLKGAAGVRYGPDAIGGLILIDPRPYPGEAGVAGDVNLVGVTNGWGGAGSAAVLSTLPVANDALSVRAEGTYRRLGDLSTPEYVLDNTALEERAVRGGARWRWPGGFVEASYSHYANDYGIFSGVVSDGPRQFFEQLESGIPNGIETFRFGYEIERPFVEVRHDVAQARARIEVTSNLALQLTYAFQDDDRREYDRTRRADRTRPQAIFRLDTHTFDLVAETGSDEFEIELGVTTNVQDNDFSGNPFIADYTKIGTAGFFMARYLADRWELEVGVRADYEYYDTIRPGRTSVAPDIRQELDFFAFTGTGGFVYELGRRWSLRGQLATASRNPSPDELFADGPTVGTASIIKGDPSLDTETTFNAQASIGYETDRASLRLEGYGHYISDYIFLAPSIREDGTPDTELTIRGAFPVFEFRQVDAGFMGFDASARVRIAPFLELTSVLSLVRARDLTNDAFLVFIPPDALRNRLTIDRAALGPLRAPYAYVESAVTLQQTRFDINADFSEPPPSYHLINVGAGCRIDVGAQPVFVDLEIRNLSNESYRDYLSRLRYFADEPGISGFLRLSVPFDHPFGGASASTSTKPTDRQNNP
jgi:iron complex outermembrane receptor protein